MERSREHLRNISIHPELENQEMFRRCSAQEIPETQIIS
jgi:hypothetical protein